jgi:hypothetical protein
MGTFNEATFLSLPDNSKQFRDNDIGEHLELVERVRQCFPFLGM